MSTVSTLITLWAATDDTSKNVLLLYMCRNVKGLLFKATTIYINGPGNQIITSFTLGTHAHESYCSLFVGCVCVCVCVSVTALVPSCDLSATKRTYQTGLRWIQKVFNMQISLKRFLSRASYGLFFALSQRRRPFLNHWSRNVEYRRPLPMGIKSISR